MTERIDYTQVIPLELMTKAQRKDYDMRERVRSLRDQLLRDQALYNQSLKLGNNVPDKPTQMQNGALSTSLS